jgi:hypothetical protein
MSGLGFSSGSGLAKGLDKIHFFACREEGAHGSENHEERFRVFKKKITFKSVWCECKGERRKGGILCSKIRSIQLTNQTLNHWSIECLFMQVNKDLPGAYVHNMSQGKLDSSKVFCGE